MRYKTNFPNGVQLPYLTNYNLGHGKNFYLQGRSIKKSYDFIADQNSNFAYLMNPPIYVSLYYEEAYTGGTSLLV